MPEPGPRPSTGITRLLRYNEPLRLPQRPETDGFKAPRVVVATHHRHGSRTLPQRPCTHADPTTPAGEDGVSDRLLPHPPTAFPLWQEGRLQRLNFRGLPEFIYFRPAHLHLGFAKDFPGGFSREISRLDCS